MAPAASTPGAPRRRAGRPAEFFSANRLSLTQLGTALSAVGRTEATPRAAFAHQWLDTFDRRLGRAGITLEWRSGPREAGPRWVLGEAGSERSWTSPGMGPAEPWSKSAWWLDQLLPPGPMRDRLTPLVGVRALLPTLRLRTRTGELRLRDAHGKIVAKVRVETISGREWPNGPAVRLSVQPLIGYHRWAARVTSVLAATPGVRPGPGGWPEALAPRPPRGPGSALSPDQPAEAAVRRIMADLLSAAEQNAPGVLADLDTEFLHDLRVAVRRARSALKLLGDCLQAAEVATLAAGLKRIGDLTTPTRDLDVHILSLAGSRNPDSTARTLVLELLRRRRAGAQRQLVRGLRSGGWTTTRRRWRQLAEEGESNPRTPGSTPIGELAGSRVAVAYRRARRAGLRVGDDSPAEELHALRKRCKELRYLLEFFAPLWVGDAHRGLLGRLRSLQDCLGEFQDAQVQSARVRQLVEEMMGAPGASAEMVLALGDYDRALGRRGQVARAEVTERFVDFAGRQARREVARLARGSR